jgi:hypothetical protein
MRVKRPEREADHTPLSSAKVKSTWSCNSTLPVNVQGAVINYAMDASSYCGAYSTQGKSYL